mmetsp:Transcript_63508/g.149498  ORF Transcript_63508/g.149498 Transcript_63508/m.149498 type:complete len:224 (-) Transcript_63508:188-859(-)|eukprot:CAMPEP_0177727314 /NCGR_PEP_ID=MMETSP0484_2-20121128/20254_1 /TAXON_ID=354590 /ORGANISM="Rhodomonas lens, Strain RHODO" /LENGTH=223 /DNA_ID=CAMNT_0019239957 /DNA_START=62 /DNA_END=733 /DNA_ORIENTATION=+
MTTAARPTFHPAVGGEDQGYFRMEGGTRQVSARDLPGHTRLKMRRQGQGTKVENERRDLKAELLEREMKAAAASARGSTTGNSVASSDIGDRGPPQALMDNDGKDADDIVAADVSDDSSDDDEDETAELMRELERIKKEREEDAARKALEDQAREEQEKQEQLLRGNPLLAGGGAGSFGVKRRWDDDVVFRNQARTEPETKKRFINDTTRNDFHKKFMSKYVK